MRHFLITLVLAAISISSNAALVSKDWQSTGDNLITHDTETGLNWLNLTATYGATFDAVTHEFRIGGQFEGFRYATDAEVEDLWLKFDIDLSTGAATSVPDWDANVQTAATQLGNTWNIYAAWDYPYGVSGITATVSGPGHSALGAYQTDWGPTVYETNGVITISDTLANIQPYGSYIVSVPEVPLPAAAWLFGSALLGLGAIKRKRS
ncbi:VPLPA-CTERM sorting domain-containing protein [Halieaceae bacterium IMCC14734]|uniref:VPLPA-CTERM sorting domain-containing protein n=1 Tax=Candidatus Litorirhabdus singularis TaxID=2518993 RepID=A0ABT3TBA1_9GAMM|nr:VPLPA-CTERM sorting domain-containing protein [Candidatus Litorirhabdus singularis]MCX2979455.1 VPLPA-CTERM sorting domain-containing protein [Candidatus Litorirhabdus singularis]